MPSRPALQRRADRSDGAAGRRMSLVPTPAVLGAVALILIGGTTVIISSHSGAPSPVSDYAPLASGGYEIAGAGALANSTPVRSVQIPQAVLDRQAEQQSEQRARALAQLVQRSQDRADELPLHQWVLPVAGYQITARWGETSSYWATYHTGLDFAAASGTPVVSVARGTVTFVGYEGVYGNKTEITLDDGTVVWYAHQGSQTVSTGDVVDPGELIGYVGSTGNVTGPHLHLEVRLADGSDSGRDVDPIGAFSVHGVRP